MIKILCKKEYIDTTYHKIHFDINNYYKIDKIFDGGFYIKDKYNKSFMFDDYSHSHYYVWNYFYTLEEIRILKLESL